MGGRRPSQRAGLALPLLLLWNGAAGAGSPALADETLMNAAAAGDLAVLAGRLASPGVDVKAVNEFGETPLHLAGIEGHAAVVDALVAARADVNALTDGTYEGHSARVRRTPLMWMVHAHGSRAGVEALLRARADVGVRSEEGTTALDMARSLRGEGRAEVAALLERALPAGGGAAAAAAAAGAGEL